MDQFFISTKLVRHCQHDFVGDSLIMRDQSLYSPKYTLNILKQDPHRSLFHVWRNGGASDFQRRDHGSTPVLVKKKF